MKFLLVEKQGGGCDYTIGCGIRTSIIEADNMKDAVAKVSGVDKYGDYILNLGNNEHSINRATLYQIASEQEVDLSGLRHERTQKEAEEQAKKTLEDKKKQLKKLKEELGES